MVRYKDRTVIPTGTPILIGMNAMTIHTFRVIGPRFRMSYSEKMAAVTPTAVANIAGTNPPATMLTDILLSGEMHKIVARADSS